MYKQQAQKIEVIVRKEGSGGDKNNGETSADNVGSQGGDISTSTGGLSRKTKRFLIVNSTHAASVGKQIARSIIHYNISGIGLQQGDQALQDIVSQRVEYMEDATGFASSVAMGVVYGATGGLPGMIAGGVIAGVSSVASLVYKYASRERDFNYKMFKENNSVEYQRARASISLTNGRLR